MTPLTPSSDLERAFQTAQSAEAQTLALNKLAEALIESEAQEIATRIGDKRLLLRILNAQGQRAVELIQLRRSPRRQTRHRHLASQRRQRLLQLAERDKARDAYKKAFRSKKNWATSAKSQCR